MTKFYSSAIYILQFSSISIEQFLMPLKTIAPQTRRHAQQWTSIMNRKKKENYNNNFFLKVIFIKSIRYITSSKKQANSLNWAEQRGCKSRKYFHSTNAITTTRTKVKNHHENAECNYSFFCCCCCCCYIL